MPAIVGLFSIFAPVTWSSAICDVSIEPSTNSDESTEFAANIVAVTVPVSPEVIIFALLLLGSGKVNSPVLLPTSNLPVFVMVNVSVPLFTAEK